MTGYFTRVRINGRDITQAEPVPCGRAILPDGTSVPVYRDWTPQDEAKWSLKVPPVYDGIRSILATQGPRR